MKSLVMNETNKLNMKTVLALSYTVAFITLKSSKVTSTTITLIHRGATFFLKKRDKYCDREMSN